MPRRPVYRTEAEAIEATRRYQRHYQANYRRQKDYNKAPHGGAHAHSQAPPPDDIAADAERRNRATHSSLTAQLCGDPKPGQSALDLIQATADREERQCDHPISALPPIPLPKRLSSQPEASGGFRRDSKPLAAHREEAPARKSL